MSDIEKFTPEDLVMQEEQVKSGDSVLERSFPEKSRYSVKSILFLVIGAIILASGILSVILSFFQNDIKGSWRLIEDDEVTVLTFQDDHTIVMTIDSLSISGTYYLRGRDIVSLDLKFMGQDVMSGDYHYVLNTEVEPVNLILTSPDGIMKHFEQGEIEQVQPPENFVKVDAILGTWKNDEHDMQYVFYETGLVCIKISGMTINGTYEVKENIITITQTAQGKKQKKDFIYELNNEKLFINGIALEKE